MSGQYKLRSKDRYAYGGSTLVDISDDKSELESRIRELSKQNPTVIYWVEEGPGLSCR